MRKFIIRGEIVRASDHRDAAEKYVRRNIREEFGRRWVDYDLRPEGQKDEDIRYWRSEASTRFQPTECWQSGEFSTREIV
jgi:hypothetical protein